MPSYYAPTGGHPGQDQIMTDRAVFTEAYAVIPKGVMQDIVTSFLPHWEATRLWVIARPMTGFAETFSHYIMEVAPGGGSDRPDDAVDAQAVLFVVGGSATLTIAGQDHVLREGGYAYPPPQMRWSLMKQSIWENSASTELCSPRCLKRTILRFVVRLPACTSDFMNGSRN